MSNDTPPADSGIEDEGFFTEAIAEMLQWDREHRAWFITSNIIRMVTGIISVFSSVLLCYTICHCRKLSSHHANRYLFCLSLHQALYMTGSSVTMDLVRLLTDSQWVDIEIFVPVTRLEEALLILIHLFACVLAVDQYVVSFSREFHWVVIGGLHGIAIVKYMISYFFIPLFSYFTVIIYGSVLLVVTGMNIARCTLKTGGELSYTAKVANIAVYSWLPLYMYHLSANFFLYVSSGIRAFLVFADILPEIVVISSQTVILFYLYKRNKYFRVALLDIFLGDGSGKDDDTLEILDDQTA